LSQEMCHITPGKKTFLKKTTSQNSNICVYSLSCLSKWDINCWMQWRI